MLGLCAIFSHYALLILALDSLSSYTSPNHISYTANKYSSIILLLHLLGFPTNRVVMEAVADKFDQNRDGYIDYKEFVEALRWSDKVYTSNFDQGN